MSSTLSVIRRSGGFRLLGDYWRLGVLRTILWDFVKGFLNGQSFRKIYEGFQPKVIRSLQDRFRPLMVSRLTEYEASSLKQQRASIVWFCWLQGIGKAPAISKVCYESLKRYLTGKEIRIIDESNRRQYVSFPDFIEERWRKKQISPAHFTDILRLALLTRYGGTWIDSTVLCTGHDYPRDYLDADLFFFQFKRSVAAPFCGVSNWFISSCSNNYVLLTLLDMLYAYWREFRSVPEYFVFHRFFDMIADARPIEVASMPYGYSPNCHALQRHWGETFDRTTWDRLLTMAPFHKLTYKIREEIKKDNSNYYNHILREWENKDV